MPNNSKEYGKTYMRDYIKKCPSEICECGGKYRKYNFYKHKKTNKHKTYENKPKQVKISPYIDHDFNSNQIETLKMRLETLEKLIEPKVI